MGGLAQGPFLVKHRTHKRVKWPIHRLWLVELQEPSGSRIPLAVAPHSLAGRVWRVGVSDTWYQGAYRSDSGTCWMGTESGERSTECPFQNLSINECNNPRECEI